MTYRYPGSAIAADYARAAAGLAISVVPLATIALAPVAIAVLCALTLVFALFALGAWRRHRTRIELEADAIAARPSGVRLGWDELTKLALAYFSVRRDREGGWMELELRAPGRSLRIDSRLDGFVDVAAYAAAAAARRALVLDAATLANLSALGIAPGAPTDAPRDAP